jgi:DHA2 family multidrug resistance protein
LERRQRFHVLRLNETLDPLNPAVREVLARGQAFFYQHTGDAPASLRMTLQSLQGVRSQQAASLAYFDVFWASGVLAGILLVLLLPMTPVVAEKGAHIAAE